MARDDSSRKPARSRSCTRTCARGQPAGTAELRRLVCRCRGESYMCTRAFTPSIVLGMALLACVLHARPAAADPIAVSGFLQGDVRFAFVEQTLDLAFPDFTISIAVDPRLSPGFSLSAGNGTAVPFTQTTGVFAAHSTGSAGPGTIDADVTGLLSFMGPTEFVDIDPVTGGAVLSAPVQVAGFLRVTQPGRLLFDGTIGGAGIGTVVYEPTLLTGARLGGFQFAFNGVATTPEPASLLLVGSGLGWVIRRRRARELVWPS